MGLGIAIQAHFEDNWQWPGLSRATTWTKKGNWLFIYFFLPYRHLRHLQKWKSFYFTTTHLKQNRMWLTLKLTNINLNDDTHCRGGYTIALEHSILLRTTRWNTRRIGRPVPSNLRQHRRIKSYFVLWSCSYSVFVLVVVWVEFLRPALVLSESVSEYKHKWWAGSAKSQIYATALILKRWL